MIFKTSTADPRREPADLPGEPATATASPAADRPARAAVPPASTGMPPPNRPPERGAAPERSARAGDGAVVPNAELIQAVLDGQVVQVTPNDDGWTDMDPAVAVATLVRSAPGLKFRIKPTTLVHWLPVWRHPKNGTGLGNVYLDRTRVPRELPAGPVVKLLRLELDAHSLEPLSVTTESP